MKNLKNLRNMSNNNLPNLNINNSTLCLNESSNNLDDINSLNMDLIEETILSTFKAYGGFSDKKEKKPFDLNSKSGSDYCPLNNSKLKNKIFDTSKISKKNERFMDENEDNYINQDNYEVSNLLKSMSQCYDKKLSNQSNGFDFGLGLGLDSSIEGQGYRNGNLNKDSNKNLNLNGVGIGHGIIPDKIQLEEMNPKGNL
jgi:hypothetical protein